MTLQEINKANLRITGSLDAKELKDAFDGMQGLIAGTRQYAFQDRLDELQENYKSLLRYRINQVKDPMEEQIYSGLRVSGYLLEEQIRENILTAESSLTYYRRRRELAQEAPLSYDAIRKQLIAVAQLGVAGTEKLFSLSEKLFDRVWTTGAFTADEADEVGEILTYPDISYIPKCQIVSALLFSLQNRWDERKVLLLFDAAESNEEEIRIRAVINLLLTLYIYRRRTDAFPQIKNRLSAYAERHPDFKRLLRTITLRFILSRDTEKITQHLQNELIPEMIKLTPALSKKFNLKDLANEQLGEEMNPEWSMMQESKALEEKMQEFNDLQCEGADVMHSSFAHLKNYPFFHEISHWMLPFTMDFARMQYPKESEGFNDQAFEALTIASFMCDSDKYSLYFSMMQLPEQVRDIIMSKNMREDITEMIQQNKEELVDKIGRTELIIRHYLQDLYRFYKLYPEHLNFDDIFNYLLDFHNLPILQPYMADEETLNCLGEYYLRKNHFSDALLIFNRLATLNPNKAELFQKIGYCKQMGDDLAGALESYLHADLLQTDSKWLIRRIAGCYRSLKQPEKALKYYRRYEELSPDNLSVQISIGHCYLELKDYDKALKYLFKVDYLDTKSHKAWRPIAWCSFLTGKYDQARNYYKKILETQPTMQDFLNAGHTEWAMQHVKNALAYYQQAVHAEKDDFQKFREQFYQDLPELEAAGIEAEEVPLMLDQLKYELEGML